MAGPSAWIFLDVPISTPSAPCRSLSMFGQKVPTQSHDAQSGMTEPMATMVRMVDGVTLRIGWR
jgi:hypothetical protein